MMISCDEISPKQPDLHLWFASAAASGLRARGELPYYAVASSAGSARKGAQGAAAKRAWELSRTRSGGVDQTRSHDQARRAVRNGRQFSWHSGVYRGADLSSETGCR